jgi:beta-glucosidase
MPSVDSSALYPFGFGQSYTTSEYSNLRISADAVNAAGEVIVRVEVKNTGTRAGDEVVQMYVKCLTSAVERSKKELRGFQSIPLRPNKTRTVWLPLKGTDLTYWHGGNQGFVVKPDRLRIVLGASPADVPLEKTIKVKEK